MSQRSSADYNGVATNAAGCSYNSLGCYLGSQYATTTSSARATAGVYVTPNYGTIGYDTLTHGESGGCGPYFTVSSAYGKNAGQCDTGYTTRLCGGCKQ